MLGTPNLHLNNIACFELHRRVGNEATKRSEVERLYEIIQHNRTANREECTKNTVPVREIFQQGARQEQTIVSFECPDKNGQGTKKTEYFTDHAQIKPLTDITAGQLKRLGVRDFLPNEHSLPECSPTSAQLVQILILLSDLPRTVLVRSNLLAPQQEQRAFREDRDSGLNIDIVSAPPGTGKTGVAIEAALAFMRGEKLAKVMRESPKWSKSVRNISPLGVHHVNSDLTGLEPCNLVILVAPDNVAGYWLKNLHHACSGVDADRYTIYPKEAGDSFIKERMHDLLRQHTHTVEEYHHPEEQIPRETLILRLTPAKFSEFLADPPSIVWPLVIFDEFTAHCGSMGTNATKPACKHLWGISATPTTIVHAFHGKSNRNPFKDLLGNHFLHAETEHIDPTDGPEHFGTTPERRQQILQSNLMVSLINAFPPDVLRRTIENVADMMPAGVDYFASHAAGCSAKAALRWHRPTSTKQQSSPTTRTIQVTDCSQEGVLTHFKQDYGIHDLETDQVGDFYTRHPYTVVRWRKPTSDHHLVPIWGRPDGKGLIHELHSAHHTYLKGAQQSTIVDWFVNTQNLLESPPNVLNPGEPLPESGDQNYACSLCCCVVNLTQLRGHF
ncbi:hypothetical protein CYMTET_42180 [Cymbomonas tetramitiformis]|uniref:Uncharacterized protein n=1 Tax=Cymbomonas tetramitiformis TaxID=36881 RepID=A0AAE0F1W8_9CHLO|nr:hypothetical protein CYMTET_42180 [Cymbomonas tetramitiformis]